MTSKILIIRNTLSLLAIMILTGCSTMHFTQSTFEQQEITTKIDSQWHNTTMNGMVEISHPVNLYKNCQGQPWQKVTVEFGFKAGVTVIVVNSFMDALIPGLSFVNMYAPWDVETHCAYPLELAKEL